MEQQSLVHDPLLLLPQVHPAHGLHHLRLGGLHDLQLRGSPDHHHHRAADLQLVKHRQRLEHGLHHLRHLHHHRHTHKLQAPRLAAITPGQ